MKDKHILSGKDKPQLGGNRALAALGLVVIGGIFATHAQGPGGGGQGMIPIDPTTGLPIGGGSGPGQPPPGGTTPGGTTPTQPISPPPPRPSGSGGRMNLAGPGSTRRVVPKPYAGLTLVGIGTPIVRAILRLPRRAISTPYGTAIAVVTPPTPTPGGPATPPGGPATPPGGPATPPPPGLPASGGPIAVGIQAPAPGR